MATTKDLVERINRLFTENRMEAFMDYLAEDVVWDMYTASGHTTFNGTAEISQMDGSNMPEHTDFRFSTIVIEGDMGSVQGSSTSKKKDGTQYESNFCDIYQFKDDKIVKMSSYVVDINRNSIKTNPTDHERSLDDYQQQKLTDGEQKVILNEKETAETDELDPKFDAGQKASETNADRDEPGNDPKTELI